MNRPSLDTKCRTRIRRVDTSSLASYRPMPVSAALRGGAESAGGTHKADDFPISYVHGHTPDMLEAAAVSYRLPPPTPRVGLGPRVWTLPAPSRTVMSSRGARLG